MHRSPKKYRVQGTKVKVTQEAVRKVLNSTKNKKASRPEDVPAELLKNGTDKLMNILAHLFERYINGETIPISWQEAWITPNSQERPKRQV